MKKIIFTLAIFAFWGMSHLFGQTKKDGTADMRFKENKEASIETPKLKADGTPDMRYKENKAADKPVPAGKLKADGTPDKRYKDNKAAEKK